MKLKTAFIAIATASFLFTGAQAIAGITINLTFDTESLANGTSGTFSISGSATSNSGSNSSWSTNSTSSVNSPGGALAADSYFSLQVATVTTLPDITYNSSAFTSNMVGTLFLSFSNSFFVNNAFTISGSSTLSPSSALFQIGNGSTDEISGTFVVQNSNIGAFSTENLNGSFGSSSGTFAPNVDLVVSAAVPEPATYAVMAGLAVLGLAAGRRRRTGRSIPAGQQG